MTILGSVAAGCGPPEAEIPPPERIILVTIDTLRADHLPRHGYPVDTAPFLTALAGESVEFHAAFSHSSTTVPSHASLFTALYPLQHLVQNNGQVLDESFITLAEILGERGFATAAFVSGNAHFRDSRVAQGFQDYDQPPADRVNKEDELRLYRPADETTDAVIEWLEERQEGDSYFLWVHYFDPHKPLQAPVEHVMQVEPRGEAARAQLLDFLIREQASQIKGDLLERIIQYDAEIRFVDSELARLFEAIEGEDTAGDSLWIVTSDHGQGLANHDWFGHHRFIYNEHLRVPLLFHFTDGSVPPRMITDQLVELVDVPVTILDLFGETFERQIAPVQGRSLVPLLRGDTRYRHKNVAFGERRRTYLRNRKASQEPGERYALQTLQEKYLSFSEGEDEFYDLGVDPYETTNLIDGDNPMKEKLRRELERMVAELQAEGSAEMVDQEVLDRLESLGYVD